jgi:nucleoside-diphosphate-sugar epimerase
MVQVSGRWRGIPPNDHGEVMIRSRVLVTGGAGYVGSKLVPALLADGWAVNVLDLYWFGDVFASLADREGLVEFKGDLRDPAMVKRAVAGCDMVIHLACISNDPSFELDPALGKSINYDCFQPLVHAAKRAGVKRFIYASSSSVYGLRDEPDVHEDLPLRPLTDYSKYKALCEDILRKEQEAGFTTLILRPATVCGYAPRLRLDLTVNILTNHAVNRGVIRVFGGDQKRPNIHIDDMVDLYRMMLEAPADKIDGKVFNAGYQNQTVMEIAQTVSSIVGKGVTINVEPTDDHRSYHISSALILRELGFVARRTISDAVTDLVAAFDSGKVPKSMDDPRYYNIRTMQMAALT